MDTALERVRSLLDCSPPLAASAPARALGWLVQHEIPTGGIRVHTQHPNAYPEVTGYIVPTVLALGQRALAGRLVRWLMCIQRGNGAYYDAMGEKPYLFDTGQVIRGLLAGRELVPGALACAERAADYLLSEMVQGGQGGFGPRYDGRIQEPIHLYVLPPLMQAAELLGRPDIRQAAQRCLDYYAGHEQALRIVHLTHFLAYELEALIDLGKPELAQPVLDELARLQKDDGSVRGRGDGQWVCSPGLAQIAICWYKTGQPDRADRALAWLERHQQEDGGFLGSYGPGAAYFPDAEPAWAVKYFLDAHRLRTLAFFERNAHRFPAAVDPTDGRAQAILAHVRDGDRVIEIGCGKGRFLGALRSAGRTVTLTGVDISPAMLAQAPAGIDAREGSLESVPCPDDSFDVVFAVEAIEHAASVESAIAEMLRLARPGGRIIIIDKQQSHWGKLDCPSWERWPEAEHLRRLLAQGCDDITCDSVGYDDQPADGLMLVWHGRKRPAGPTGAWYPGRISPEAGQEVIRRIRHNQLLPWTQELLLASSPGQQVLSLGGEAVEAILALALAGRQVTAVEASGQGVEFIDRCAAELGVSVRTVCADAAGPLADFAEGQFDCVWSSGLLEHFPVEQQRAILRECARVSRNLVIMLAPNADCLAYRMGKSQLESAGQWRYGRETPIRTLRDQFASAGLCVEAEYSVGGRHAVNFIPQGHPLREPLGAWLAQMPEQELRGWNQGYLLITRGRKPRPGERTATL